MSIRVQHYNELFSPGASRTTIFDILFSEIIHNYNNGLERKKYKTGTMLGLSFTGLHSQTTLSSMRLVRNTDQRVITKVKADAGMAGNLYLLMSDKHGLSDDILRNLGICVEGPVFYESGPWSNIESPLKSYSHHVTIMDSSFPTIADEVETRLDKERLLFNLSNGTRVVKDEYSYPVSFHWENV